jgi:hypothetical protein
MFCEVLILVFFSFFVISLFINSIYLFNFLIQYYIILEIMLHNFFIFFIRLYTGIIDLVFFFDFNL